MIRATEGKYKGKMRPITHICAYVITPLEENKPKCLVFAQVSWDGCARKRQKATMDAIVKSLDLVSLST